MKISLRAILSCLVMWVIIHTQLGWMFPSVNFQWWQSLLITLSAQLGFAIAFLYENWKKISRK